MALIRIGTERDGDPAELDARAARAWFAADALAEVRLGVDLSARIIQALGAAKASAGVHKLPGVCVDIRTRGWSKALILDVVALLRECGFAGTWYRDWEGNQHIHAATDIVEWTPALYQIHAVKAGYDGTGSGGRGAPDPHPRPSAWRNAITGAAWAAQQLGEEMAITAAETAAIAQASAEATVARLLNQFLGLSGPTVAVALQDGYWQTIMAKRTVEELLVAVKASAGADVDEAALAGDIAGLIAPVVGSAVLEAAEKGGSPAAIAAAVVELLGAAITKGAAA